NRRRRRARGDGVAPQPGPGLIRGGAGRLEAALGLLGRASHPFKGLLALRRLSLELSIFQLQLEVEFGDLLRAGHYEALRIAIVTASRATGAISSPKRPGNRSATVRAHGRGSTVVPHAATNPSSRYRP